ncbi:MAG TPA: hypothetical protein VIR27_07825 [Mycobacteriales bacterium]
MQFALSVGQAAASSRAGCRRPDRRSVPGQDPEPDEPDEELDDPDDGTVVDEDDVDDEVADPPDAPDDSPVLVALAFDDSGCDDPLRERRSLRLSLW